MSDCLAERVAKDRGVVGLILAASLVLFVGLRARVISVPFERDEGEYAYIAQRMSAGDVPYRDAFIQKTPGVVFVYAAAFGLMGESVEAVHLALYFFTAATAGLLYLLVKELRDGLAAALSVLVFVVLSVEPRLLATAANTEQFGLLPITASLLTFLYARRSGRRIWWFACGASCIAAFWFKQVALAPAAIVPTWSLLSVITGRRRPLRATLIDGATWLSGALVVSMPIVAYLAFNGAWDDFVYCAFSHNLEYARRVPADEGIRALAYALIRQAPVMAVVWALALVGWIGARRAECITDAGTSRAAVRASPGADDRDDRGRLYNTADYVTSRRLKPAARWFLGAWLVLSFVSIASALNFYQHYFVWWLPPMAALAGMGASYAVRLSVRWGKICKWTGGAAVIGIIGAPTVLANRSVWFADTTARMAAIMYGENVFAEAAVIGAYIRNHSAEDDSVYILGSEPQILYHARRRSATRYIIMYPLFGPYGDAAQRQREVLADVAKATPKWILDVRLENSRTPNAHRPLELERQTSAVLLPGQGYVLEGLAVPSSRRLRFDLYFGHEARSRVGRYGPPKAGVLMYVRSGATITAGKE